MQCPPPPCYRYQEFKFFDQYVTIGYESASGDASVPFLRVENCDLHGNSIVSTPRWNRLRHGHDRVTVQIAVFNVAREKRARGSLVKLITCVTSGGTNFHIWHNSELAGSRGEISHRKLEFFELKGYESASRGPSVRSPCVEKIGEPGDEARFNSITTSPLSLTVVSRGQT